MDNMLIETYQGFVDEMYNTWPTLFKHDNSELFRFIVYNKYVVNKITKKCNVYFTDQQPWNIIYCCKWIHTNSFYL